MSRYRWKGRFTKKKVYNAMLQRSENAKSRLKKLEEEKSKLKEETPQVEEEKSTCVVAGSRIIDVKHMVDQMYCCNCSEPLLMQSIENEIITGLASTFYVRCHECLLMNTVKSGKEYINPSSGNKVFSVNTKMVLGAIHTGIGQTHVNEICNIINIPNVNPQLFKKHERIIGPVIEYIAKESCSEATALERVMTENCVDELKKLLPPEIQDGYLIVNANAADSNDVPIVRIFASYDMGWSQRGNGYTYDSLNGYCALIGMQTGKVLDYCTRNRKCNICDSELRTGLHKEHDCRLNFTGSAKAMEADGAVQLVTESQILKQSNVQVGIFIGDNDSSSMSAIQEASDYTIIKQSDMNHTTKGVGNYLYEIHKDVKKDPEKELTKDIIKHIQRCFTFAIHQNKGKILDIQSALKNIPDHLFDNHSNCGEWCRGDKENSSGIYLNNKDLYEALKNLFSQLAENALKFTIAASSQPNESLNHSMCSKAPKGISYSTSESADYRFSATVAQKNKGKDYLSRSLDVLDIDCDDLKFKKHIENYDKLRLKIKEKTRHPIFKKQRLELKARRSQLRNQKERSETNTYKSNMTLLDSSQPQKHIEIVNIDVPNIYKDHNLAIVFFDIETNSLKANCDILQISMKCHEYILNIFITPTQYIQPSATKVNGFSKVHKKLFQHGKEITTISRETACKKVLEYLQLFGKKCILVAHNCSFDSTRFLTMIKKSSLTSQYEEYIYGFCDTLQMFRNKFRKREGGYKLTSLASELLHLPCEGAHDAQFDVSLLENLSLAYFSSTDITDACKTIYQVMEQMDNVENMKKLLPSFQPMKDILSTTMRSRLASHGISYELIVETYKTKGIEDTKSLLQGSINGKPRIMKTTKNINKIVEYLSALT